MTNWEEASQTPGTCFNSCGCFLPDLTRLAILQCGEARPRVFYIKLMLGRVTKSVKQQKRTYIRYNSPPNSERWMSGLSHHPGKVAYA